MLAREELEELVDRVHLLRAAARCGAVRTEDADALLGDLLAAGRHGHDVEPLVAAVCAVRPDNAAQPVLVVRWDDQVTEAQVLAAPGYGVLTLRVPALTTAAQVAHLAAAHGVADLLPHCPHRHAQGAEHRHDWALHADMEAACAHLLHTWAHPVFLAMLRTLVRSHAAIGTGQPPSAADVVLSLLADAA